MKTQSELENLKSQWKSDPCWDIEYTDGFEEYREELLNFRLDSEKRWKEKEQNRLELKAIKLGCTVALVEYIESLGYRIKQLELQNERV